MAPPKTFIIVLINLLGTLANALAVADWPTERRGLVAAVPDGLTPPWLQDPDGQPRYGWQLVPRGHGHTRHDGVFLLTQGGFEAGAVAEHLAALVSGRQDMTLNLGIHASSTPSDGALLTAVGTGAPLFRLYQSGPSLHVAFNETSGETVVAAGSLDPLDVTDLAIVRQDNHLSIYRDGMMVREATLTTETGTLERLALYLGQRPGTGSGWAGGVDAWCVYDRALSAREVDVLHRDIKVVRADRPTRSTLQVRATLEGKSTVLTPTELAPYHRGLTVFRYAVAAVLAGTYRGTELHVAHWTVLDDQSLPFATTPIGTTVDLRLELFDDNPQLATENLSDDIVTDFSIPYYYDAGGRALTGATPGPSR